MGTHIKSMMDNFLDKLPTTARSHFTADWLLVSCIDCRYPHVMHNFMRRYYSGELYDQLCLAGASVAATTKYSHEPNWESTFKAHVSLALRMHSIGGVLIVDHRTCGAFREFGLLTQLEENTSKELQVHTLVATDAAPLIADVFHQSGNSYVIQAYLAPEVTDPAADDFASPPELLVELQS